MQNDSSEPVGSWTRELYEALRNAERTAAAGGAYGLAQRLGAMADPLASVIADDYLVDLVAEVAGVKRVPEDVCIVNVPAHWIEGLRAKAKMPLPSVLPPTR